MKRILLFTAIVALLASCNRDPFIGTQLWYGKINNIKKQVS